VYKPQEDRNDENEAKSQKADRLRSEGPSPGAREKSPGKDPPYPYPEPTQVPLAE